MRAAILPVGYADGYKHALSNRAEVLIHGQRCPVRGSVCMDQIVVDVSQLPDVKTGDTATLIGTDGQETITAEELAERARTIPYDILTGIGARVAREYLGELAPARPPRSSTV
jgi:alanine racemase